MNQRELQNLILNDAGFNAGGNQTNTIDFVTIDSTGNASDFGDLTDTNSRTSGASDAHGVLQA